MGARVSISVSIPLINLASVGLGNALLPVSKDIVQLSAKDHPMFGKYHGCFFKRRADLGGESLELMPELTVSESPEPPTELQHGQQMVQVQKPTLEERVLAFRENEASLSQDLATLIQCVGQIVETAQSDGIQPTPGDLMIPMHEGPPLTNDVVEIKPKGEPSSALEKTKPSSARAYSDRPDMAIAASKKQAVQVFKWKELPADAKAVFEKEFHGMDEGPTKIEKLDTGEWRVTFPSHIETGVIGPDQVWRFSTASKTAAPAPARKPLKVVNPDVPTLIESFFQKNPQAGHALIDTSDDPGRPHFFQVRNEGGQWSIRSMEMSYKFGPPQQYPSLKALGDTLDQNTSGRYRVVTGKLAEAAQFAAELD